jgi:hypothetical protein
MMLAALSACSSLPTGPHDLLDEHTGATVTVVGAPITFAREPNGQSSQDFLTLVAIQKDDAGRYTDFLLLYSWSGFPGLVTSSPEAAVATLLIGIDGHSIELQPLQRLPAGLPAPKELFVPDTTQAAMRAYASDLETMRLIAASHELTLRLPRQSPDGVYEVWRDGRPALAQFVKHLAGP